VVYEPVFTKEFQRCVKRYANIAKLIQKEVDSILHDPYHNSELLTKKKRDWRGWRSRRVTRSFRIVYTVCEECIGRSFRERGYLMCSGCVKEIRDNKVIFLHVRPHPEAY
jgi:Txe/YoeB family toxin of Txe-Axe toxin-antitoxin module